MMDAALAARVSEAKAAALKVLRYNLHGPHGLPRTAGWGYPEPYTRDLMLSAFGMLVSGDDMLVDAVRRTLESLARNMTPLGHVASLAHDPYDLGASDTTPLFLVGLALYRQVSGEADFLEDAAQRAMTWMDYQSPSDEVMVGQLPTSDWRDEQWVIGYGLFVNTLVYTYLLQYGEDRKAQRLRNLARHFIIKGGVLQHHVHEGLVVPYKPYFALWSYKVFNSERFDLLGNSLAILSGLVSAKRAHALVTWIEEECDAMRNAGDLAVGVPPNLFPFIRPEHPDWHPRYTEHNRPGEYHNGGIWPFISALYVVALLAAGHPRLAERKLDALTDLVRLTTDPALEWGFNEWIKAQDGTPRGNDWQTWSAALYLYAATCVERGETLFFTALRERAWGSNGE
jgi:hypothetical protein